MALQFTAAGAFVKALIPDLKGLIARSGKGFSGLAPSRSAPRATTPYAAPLIRLSPHAEAELARLDLPPDGPIDPNAALRAKLTPDVAARNFVSWARALDLAGNYSAQSIYTLYCEFSEVDNRPPLGERRFLEALAQTEGIGRDRLRIDTGDGKVRRPWQWTIEPAKHVEEAPEAMAAAATPVEATPAAAVAPDAARPEPAAAPAPAPSATRVIAMPDPLARPLPAAKPVQPGAAILVRFVPDHEHPFSPAGLREQAKHARRARLNAAASRKQRGALRRAA